MKSFLIRIEEKLDKKLTRICRVEGFNKSGLIRKLIRDFVESHGSTSDPLLEAEKFGIDISLLRSNLRKSPTERLRDQEQAHAFAQTLKKAKSATKAQ